MNSSVMPSQTGELRVVRDADDVASSPSPEAVADWGESISPSKSPTAVETEEILPASIPTADDYEFSLVHVWLCHAIATNNLIITASSDGYVKLWGKGDGDKVELKKEIRCNTGLLLQMAQNCGGTLLSTISRENPFHFSSARIVDLVNMEIINTIELGYIPSVCEWICSPSAPISVLAVADSHKIHLYDGKGDGTPLATLDKLHLQPILLIRYNPVFDATISVDQSGVIEYFGGFKSEFKFPTNLAWESKSETDLDAFVKCKTLPISLELSLDGRHFVCLCQDKKIRIFSYSGGKLVYTIEESVYSDPSAKQRPALPEFDMHEWVEEHFSPLANAIFDASGNFIIYTCSLGIKVVDVKRSRVVRTIDKSESSIRFLHLALRRSSRESFPSNPMLVATGCDYSDTVRPVLKCYVFTNSEPSEADKVGHRREVRQEPLADEKWTEANLTDDEICRQVAILLRWTETEATGDWAIGGKFGSELDRLGLVLIQLKRQYEECDAMAGGQVTQICLDIKKSGGVRKFVGRLHTGDLKLPQVADENLDELKDQWPQWPEWPMVKSDRPTSSRLYNQTRDVEILRPNIESEIRDRRLTAVWHEEDSMPEENRRWYHRFEELGLTGEAHETVLKEIEKELNSAA